MNRCAICNKFKPWKELGYLKESMELDLLGNLTQEEWYECYSCSPHQKPHEALSSQNGFGVQNVTMPKRSKV